MSTVKQTTEKLPEFVIIQKILDGEVELFEILLRRYNELLFRTIRSYINSEYDVEDVMQDTYIKAYEKLYQFKNDALFSTWLVRIGINEALQRKRKVSRLKISDIAVEQNINQLTNISLMDPEKRTIQKESIAFLEKAVDMLPEKYKIVYMLKEVEGMNISEISNCLDLSNSNVKVRLHRARTMMKDTILLLTNTSNIFEFGNSKCDRIVETVMRRIGALNTFS
ncbi:RNA polymerase sigma factor [Flavobacteriaceae bacterium LMO-SS05]